MLDTLRQDLAYALRSWRRTPCPLVLAALTMALGIGATTSVFSVVDRLLFRPLPYSHQDRLVWFGMTAPINPTEFLLEGDYYHFRQHQQVFEALTSFSMRSADCDLNEAEPLRLACGYVAADFLPTFGLAPQIGRNFSPDEDVPNGPRTALLSDGFWARRFGRDRAVIGKTLVIDGSPAQVIGVLPADFEMPTLSRPDIVLPQQLNLAPRVTFSFLRVFGRLKPGVSIEQARTSLQPLYLESLKNVPAGFAKEVSFAVNLLRDRQVRDYRTTSLILLACVGGVLLIACANVANLLLARAVARHRELAVRAALGASRGRIARQMMTESAVLGAIGGGLGILLSAALLQAMVSLAPESIPRLREATLDPRALLFALAVAAASTIFFGIAPAMLTPKAETLNTARVAGSGLPLRQALVALQMGVTFVLLSGAGLLLQSLWNMQKVNLGLRTDNLITIRVQLPQQRYGKPPQQSEFFENALASLERMPGVRAVALTDSIPLSGPATTMIYSNIEIQGHAPPDPKRQTGGMTVFRTVTPSYFQALGIPIIRGRAFTEADRAGSEEMVILDEALAARLFQAEDPLGRRFRSGLAGPFRTIVGICRRAKNSTLTTPDDPEYYYLWRKSLDFGRRRANILLRSDANIAPMMQLVRQEIGRLDREIPLTMDTMEQNIGRLLTRPRFEGLLLALFALAGVLLAAVGQFSVISYLVTQRSPEIGVRMALGASTSHVVGLVLRHTLIWTLLGAAAGAAASWYAGRYVESLLYGVRSTDAVALAAALVLLVLVSLAAALQPTRRAIGVDPARALRHE